MVLQGGTPGAYLASFSALAQLPDLWISEIKALIFGFIAGVVACYKGLSCKGGPKGVGDAVNQSVVITFMLLFVTNFVMTAVMPVAVDVDCRYRICHTRSSRISTRTSTYILMINVP